MRRMLILEDCEDIRAMMSLLTTRGTKATVTATGSPQEAMSHLDSTDILCTDMNLKSMLTGLDVAKAFKTKKPWGQVILFSGAEVPKSPYVDQVLRKPAFPEAVQQAVQKAIQVLEARAEPIARQVRRALETSRAIVERSQGLRTQLRYRV